MLVLAKYASLVSLPLFGITSYYLLLQVPEFVLSKQKVSKLIYYLEHSKHRWIFRLNFLLKALLDFLFGIYLVDALGMEYSSPLGLMLITTSLLFASLAYFTVDTYYTIHKIIIYVYGIILPLTYIYLAHLTGDMNFILITYCVGLVTSIIAFYALFKKKTNVYIQIFCTSVLYIWLLYFVLKYL